MDHCAAVLLSFPTAAVQANPHNKEKFDNALRSHVSSIFDTLLKEQGEAIFTNALQLLEVRRQCSGRRGNRLRF